jgi:hypothetical protein
MALAPVGDIERCILLIRGHKVMLDSHLARLYAVETRVLVQAVKRNRGRFPEDFMFQLTWEETANLTSHSVIPSEEGEQGLRSQSVILNDGDAGVLRSQIMTLKRGSHRKYRPYAFTEQGVAMLSSVLRSERAVQVNIEVMRAFVRLRRMLSAHRGLAQRLDDLEKKYNGHFAVVFEAIRELMAPPEPRRRRRIGFHVRPDLPGESGG